MGELERERLEAQVSILVVNDAAYELSVCHNVLVVVKILKL